MPRIKNTHLQDPKVSYGIVLLAAMALYVITCAPGPLWQDSGMFQYRIWNNDVEGGLGLALAHPLYHIIGIAVKAIPVGEFGYRVNLISAVCGAFAVANLFLLLRLWLGTTLPAVIGAGALGLCHTFWQHSAIAEIYTLHAALFTAELIFLLQYVRTKRVGYLYWLGLINGLGIANHMLASISLSCYVVLFVALLVKKEIRLRNLAIIVLLWVIGSAPYEYLIVRNIFDSGDLVGTISSAVFGRSWQGAVLNAAITGRIVKENLLFILLNFPTPNGLLFFAGLFGLYKTTIDRRFGYVILALLVLLFVFAFRYTVPDRYAFFLPFYCVASILIGVGAHHFFERYRRKVFAVAVLIFTLLPVGVYAVVPTLAERMKVNLGTKRTIPCRNEYTYFLRPWQCGNNGPHIFAKEALNSVENNAIICADGTTVYALWYYQAVTGARSDVKVVSGHGDYDSPLPVPTAETIAEIMAERCVYVVSPVKGYCPDFLLEGYDFERVGVVYRVKDRREIE